MKWLLVLGIPPFRGRNGAGYEGFSGGAPAVSQSVSQSGSGILIGVALLRQRNIFRGTTYGATRATCRKT